MKKLTMAPNTLIVNFPSITAKDIYQKSKNKIGDSKLLFDVDWYKDEIFFATEKTRPGKREVILELQHLGKSWDECDRSRGKYEMHNLAEVMYMVWEYPQYRKMLKDKYTWTSSRLSDGRLVDVGSFGADGADVSGWNPDDSSCHLGVSLSRRLEDLK